MLLDKYRLMGTSRGSEAFSERFGMNIQVRCNKALGPSLRSSSLFPNEFTGAEGWENKSETTV